MGIFSKLKQRLNGGVTLQLGVPSTVAENQIIPVSVTVVADSAQTVASVKAVLKVEAKEQGMTMGGGIGVQQSETMAQTIAQVQSNEPFTLAPGETKTVNLELYINGGAGVGNPMAQLSNVGGALGGVLQAVASAAQGFQHVNYLYTVHASADVEGVSIDPSAKVAIQIIPASVIQPPATGGTVS